MRLTLALQGSLRAQLEAERRAGAAAVTRAMGAAAQGLKQTLRDQVQAAGLGPRLARAWRTAVYPKGQASLGAAATVSSSAPKVHGAFDDGALIRSAAGLWLAIPTEAAPKRGVSGKRISPSTFPEAAYGPLRFVYRPGKPALLVVDGLRARKGKRGGFGRASARAQSRGETATVVMFVLVPQVRLKKRLDIAGAAEAWGTKLPAMILDAWEAARAEQA